MDTTLFVSCRNKIVGNCSKVIVGKDEAIEKVLISLVCGGHVLLEDLPGTGKTMLLRSFSKSIGGDFRRIQFTPDLMPSDLTGINFYNQKTGEFEFRKGPLFTNIVLADEINRATPRTQSSLLEAMEEHQISADGNTYALAEPFMVMATQNPLESYGTFPLPEAEMDRFFMRLSLGYMKREEELQVLRRTSAIDLISQLECVITPEELKKLQNSYHEVEVSDDTAGYLMDIIEATRTSSRLTCGASTRGAIALYHAAQVKAAFSGRDYVIPEDIKSLTVPVLAHRLGTSGSTQDIEKYLTELLETIKVPMENN